MVLTQAGHTGSLTSVYPKGGTATDFWNGNVTFGVTSVTNQDPVGNGRAEVAGDGNLKFDSDLTDPFDVVSGLPSFGPAINANDLKITNASPLYRAITLVVRPIGEDFFGNDCSAFPNRSAGLHCI